MGVLAGGTCSCCCASNHGCPTRGPPSCLMRPTATFINYAYTVKSTEYFKLLRILLVIFPCAARGSALNNRCATSLRLRPRILVPSIFPSITCTIRQFLRSMWPTQLAFFFVVCGMFLSSWLYSALPHCAHDLSNWYSQFFHSSTLQNLQGVSDLSSEVSASYKTTQQM